MRVNNWQDYLKENVGEDDLKEEAEILPDQKLYECNVKSALL